MRHYHNDERVGGDHLIVQLLRHHHHATLWVQMEELGAGRVEAAVDWVHQFTVGVGVLRADLQDVLPRRRILRNPHLKKKTKNRYRGGNEACFSMYWRKRWWQETTGFEKWKLNSSTFFLLCFKDKKPAEEMKSSIYGEKTRVETRGNWLLCLSKQQWCSRLPTVGLTVWWSR